MVLLFLLVENRQNERYKNVCIIEFPFKTTQGFLLKSMHSIFLQIFLSWHKLNNKNMGIDVCTKMG